MSRAPKPKRKAEYGGPLHRIANKPTSGHGPRVNLKADHPALTEGRTLFPSRVVHPRDTPRLLVSGMNQRKIGRTVTKGHWKGLPIYTLTLEERATCPSTCLEWVSCYGNQMNWARRHMPGLALEGRLIEELVDLQRRHPRGFAIRLHILGDFYSEIYADLWRMAMDEIPQIHLFGFTAHAPDSEIGRRLLVLNDQWPLRCRIRFSGTAGNDGSLVIGSFEDSRHVVCPVQSGKTDCCGTCGLCWTMDRTVEFVRH